VVNDDADRCGFNDVVINEGFLDLTDLADGVYLLVSTHMEF